MMISRQACSLMALCLTCSITIAAVLKIRKNNDGVGAMSAYHPHRALSSNTNYSAHHHHHHHGIFTDDQAAENAQLVQSTRSSFQQLCSEQMDDSQQLKNVINGMFQKSMIRQGTHEDSLPIQTCNRVFLDLGSHTGQSVAQFIDAGLPTCPGMSVGSRWNYEMGSARPTNINSTHHHTSSLTTWVKERLHEFDPKDASPEDYCVFSVEANPVFTTQLKAMERDIMRTTPRPVRRLHFLTDTAIADKTKPTKLYLDTVSSQKGNHMFGSSIYSMHSDVQRSYQQYPSVLSAAVEGLSFSALLKQTLSGQHGGHVMIKMDIEGAEYKALTQAVKSNALCGYVTRNKMKVDLLVEYHSSERVGDNEDLDLYESMLIRQQMKDCGVNLYEVESTE